MKISVGVSVGNAGGISRGVLEEVPERSPMEKQSGKIPLKNRKAIFHRVVDEILRKKNPEKYPNNSEKTPEATNWDSSRKKS